MERKLENEKKVRKEGKEPKEYHPSALLGGFTLFVFFQEDGICAG